jgi:poly-gamma-glutamate synthesis protein (capsule biosynthesis protein)
MMKFVGKFLIVLGLAAAAVLLVYLSPSGSMTVSVENAGFEKEERTASLSIGGENTEKVAIERIAEGYFKPYNSQEKFYEKAYKDLADVEPFERRAFAGILPHHLIFPEYIAEYFGRLSKTQDVKTFVVVGPNHFGFGGNSICVSEYGFATPYGNLEPDFEIVDALTAGGYADWDEKCFADEHSINSLTSFIKKSFPDAKIAAVVLKNQLSEKKLDKFVDGLNGILGADDFVLASIDFSHYMVQNVADFHDEATQTVIENFDLDGIDQLEIDSKPTLYTVLKYAEVCGLTRANILHHTNSAEKTNGREFVAETTSHFYVSFDGGENENSRDFTILSLGDVMLGRYVRTLMDSAGNNNYPFELIKGTENRFFSGSDVIFGNLEGPIQGEGYKSGTSLIFGFGEDTAPLLNNFGFDVMSVANNHTMNQGADGLESTYLNLSGSSVDACGSPVNSSDHIVYKNFGNKKAAFVCFNDIEVRFDPNSVIGLIETLDSTVDYVIVSIHWGIEYQHTPSEQKQIIPAHKFVDAGADLVIGHHPHVVQPFEIYNGVPIIYSLGNFIFDQYWSYDTQEELGIGVVLGDEKIKLYLFPMLSRKSQPYLMDYEERQKFYDRFLSWWDYPPEIASQIRNSLIEISR